MKCFLPLATTLTVFTSLALFLAKEPEAAEPGETRSSDPEYADLFNGVDLTGWVDVNTSP